MNDCQVLRLSDANVRRVFESDPELEFLVNCLVSKDITRKLYVINDNVYSASKRARSGDTEALGAKWSLAKAAFSGVARAAPRRRRVCRGPSTCAGPTPTTRSTPAARLVNQRKIRNQMN